MDNNSELDLSIYICTFSARVLTANVLIKFPCNYFLEWKTTNGKKVVQGKSRPTAKNSIVDFNETLEMSTEMVFDNTTAKFLRKETLLNLNLISKARQDQVKLIGRVAIDLADIANRQQHLQAKSYKLSYCSVDAELTFSACMEGKRLTNMSAQDLDKSSFNDYLSFYSCGSNPKEGRHRRELANTETEETSIGYGRQTQEHVIDLPVNDQRHSRAFNQTFFMFSSPTVNRRETSKTIRENMNESERHSNIRSQFAVRPPSGNKQIINSRSTQLTQLPVGRVKTEETSRIQEDRSTWDKEKQHFRGEIDSNRLRIEDLERKIVDLNINLEQSKRHLQFTERQNREKEEIIKILKQSQFRADSQTQKRRIDAEMQKSMQNLHLKQYLELEEKVERLNREKSKDQQQWRSREDNYRNEIKQLQSSIDNMRKETDEFRKIWQQKKDHYEDKIMNGQTRIKEKEIKIGQLNSKIEDLLKYKYQYQVLKQLNEEKDNKLKETQKNLNKIKLQIQQINKNNYAEEIYKLKMQLSQTTKSYEDLIIKYSKNEVEINKYKENYIKIQTAYQIQGKNYDSCKEKNNQNQILIAALQKQVIELRSNLNTSNKALQELNNRVENARNDQVQQKAYQLLQRQHEKSLYDLETALKQKQDLNNFIQKLRRQQQAKSRDLEQKLKKIESTITISQEQKEKQIKQELDKLIMQVSELTASKRQLQQLVSTLQVNLSNLRHSNQTDMKNKEELIANLESTLSDKQEIIRMCNSQMETLKETNNDLAHTLKEMSIKQKQLEQNITILQEQSHKILYILQLKEQVDKELEEIQLKYQNVLQQLSQQKIKIQQYEGLIKEKDQILSQHHQKIETISSQISKLSATVQMQQHQLSQKQNFLLQKQKENRLLESRLNDAHSSIETMNEELSHFKDQALKLKKMVEEINDKYEQQLQIQENYHDELTSVRQEKQELELFINKNTNQFANHNEQLENRVSFLQKEIERIQSENSLREEERKHFQERCILLQNEKKTLLDELETSKVHLMRLQGIKNETEGKLTVKTDDQEAIKFKLTQAQTQVQQQKCLITELQQQLINKQKDNQMLTQKIQQSQSSLYLIQAKNNNLSERMENLQQQIQSSQLQQKLQKYNQIIQMDEDVQMQAAKSILEQKIVQQKVVDGQRQYIMYQQLQDNRNKVKALEDRIEELNMQIRNLVYQLEKKNSTALFEDFSQFHREEMTKIIQQQRKEIDRLEAQNKLRVSKSSAALENRIRQLEANIIELQSSFRMEIDRILSGHTNKEPQHGLSVINEETIEEQTLRSEKSIASLIVTPSRVKQSFDSSEAIQFKQKLMMLQEQKQHLESLLEASEEQKFNLTSTINEKQIVLEDALRAKQMIQMEMQELKKISFNAQSLLQSLQAEVESLRNQINFGTSILLNDQSVTRSEPIITNEMTTQTYNKNVQIENLRAEVQRCKAREEELTWTIKDLEMQLEAVTENLNLFNDNFMNSLLNSPAQLSYGEDQYYGNPVECQKGCSKERLLESLKRNQDLKVMAHSIIRALKQREKEVEQKQKTALSDKGTLKIEEQNKKIHPLCDNH